MSSSVSVMHNPHGSLASRRSQCLRLLTFNAQAGIHTQHYGHYLTRSWQHVIPCIAKQYNMQHIGYFLSQFDMVALQEVDGGSWRSAYQNHVELLAKLGHFPFWFQQVNRNLGRFAQHSNGLLSRWPLTHVENHPLPGLAGRGAIFARLGQGIDSIAIIATHLALSRKSRIQQLDYIYELVKNYRHIIIMGDLNAPSDELLTHSALKNLSLHSAQQLPTYPSWRPMRCLDHILLSSSLTVTHVAVLEQVISDHRPVSVDIKLPQAAENYWPPLPLPK